jgi:hypothetical protein
MTSLPRGVVAPLSEIVGVVARRQTSARDLREFLGWNYGGVEQLELALVALRITKYPHVSTGCRFGSGVCDEKFRLGSRLDKVPLDLFCGPHHPAPRCASMTQRVVRHNYVGNRAQRELSSGLTGGKPRTQRYSLADRRFRTLSGNSVRVDFVTVFSGKLRTCVSNTGKLAPNKSKSSARSNMAAHDCASLTSAGRGRAYSRTKLPKNWPLAAATNQFAQPNTNYPATVSRARGLSLRSSNLWCRSNPARAVSFSNHAVDLLQGPSARGLCLENHEAMFIQNFASRTATASRCSA